MADPFFLISWAGVFLGCALAIGMKRFRRRVRPVTFRRRRRVIAPGLLVVAAGLLCAAVLMDVHSLVDWWGWSVALLVVPAALVGLALGVPGGPLILPVRVFLLAVLIVPGLIAFRGWDAAGAAVPGELLTFWIDAAPSGGDLIWSDGTGPETILPVDIRIEVSGELSIRAEPLWWMPAPGRVVRVVVRAGEQTREVVFRDSPRVAAVPGAMYRHLDGALREQGLIRDVLVTGTIPGRPNRFIQPGRYAVIIDGDGAHSLELTYRYSGQ